MRQILSAATDKLIGPASLAASNATRHLVFADSTIREELITG
ncbi:hypothetical protein AB0B89_09770 [Sphaerisporangium sp. NPDC049002]